jgi:hypothetical protein
MHNTKIYYFVFNFWFGFVLGFCVMFIIAFHGVLYEYAKDINYIPYMYYYCSGVLVGFIVMTFQFFNLKLITNIHNYEQMIKNAKSI